MKRSLGVTFAAVVALLGSLATLLMGLFLVLFLILSNYAPKSPALHTTVTLLSALILIVPAGLGIATSVGLFRLKRWARISILIFAALLALMGFFTPFFLLTAPAPPNTGQAPEIWRYTQIALSVFYFFLAAIGVWWLVFFNRKAVKDQFTAGQPLAPDARPVSITVIGWLLILGVLSIPISLGLHLPGMLFGYTFTGWLAVLWYLILAGIGLYAGVGLLRLDPRGRLVAIYYLVFGALNGALVYLLPGYSQRMATVMNSMPAGFRPGSNEPPALPNPWLLAIFIFVFLFVQLYFLIREKAAFYKSPTPDSPLAPGIS